MANNFLSYCVFGLPLFFGSLLFGQKPLATNFQELVSATDTSSAARRSPAIAQTTLKIVTTSILRSINQVPYSQTLQATGGTSPYTWSINTGSLPTGLTLGASSGMISGSSTISGSFSVTIKVIDAANAIATSAFLLEAVAQVQIAIINQEPLPSATVGKFYTMALPASGGVSPYTWASLDPLNIPPGMSFSNTGILSGTPTAAGTFYPNIQVQDSGIYGSPCCAGKQASTVLTITVEPTFRIVTSSLPDGPIGTFYSATVSAAGGVAPTGRTWNILSGVLPDGLQLQALVPLSDNINIIGTPTRAGLFNFTIQVTNTGRDSISRSLSIRITAPLQITSTTLPRAFTGTPFAQTLGVSGGVPPYLWTTAPNPISPGLIIDSGLGIIRGVPSQEGTFGFTATVTDGQGTLQSRQFSLTITAPLPTLTLSVPTLTFSYQIGDTLPGSQIVFLTSSGAAVSFTTQAVSSGGWLSVGSTSSTAPATLNVAVNPSALAAGTYNGSIAINSTNAANGSLTIPVTITVIAAPLLTASPTQLTFNYQAGGQLPPVQTLSLTSAPSGAALQIDSSVPWLAASPVSTATPAAIFVSVTPAALNPGTYTGTLRVTSAGASNSPLTVNVTLIVSQAPTISASFAQLNFNYSIGGPQPPGQPVSISSTIGTTFNISTGTAAWLTVTPASGTISNSAPTQLLVTVNAGTLAQGTYNGNITITGQGIVNSPQVLPVILTIAPPSAITVSPNQLAFVAVLAGTPPDVQTISITAASAVNYTVSVGSTSWLIAVPSSVATPGTVTIGISAAGLAAGSYTGAVTIIAPGSSNSPQVVPVTLTVSGQQPLTVVPTQLAFNYQINDSIPAPQSITISSNSTQQFTYSAGNTPWLFVTASGNRTPGTLSVSVNPIAMAAGKYNGSISITPANGTAQTIAVSLTVGSGQVFTLNPGQLSFSVQAGTTPPAQTIAISAVTPGAFTATTITPWMTVSPLGGTTPSTITVTVNAVGLATGSYNGSVMIGGAGSSQVLPVVLTVSQTSPIAVSINQVNFSYFLGGAVPSSQTVAISTPLPTPFVVNTGSTKWLQATSNRTTTPATLSVSVNPAGLTAGTLTGAITVAPAADLASAQTINISLQITVPSTPLFTADAVVNAASYQPGLVPGSIATLFGRNLSSVAGIVLSGGKTIESGTSVKVGDVLSPLLGVANIDGQEQISFQVPFEVQPGTTTVEVANRSGALRLQGVPVLTAQPGIFEILDNASNAYVAAVIHQDGTLVSGTDPARRNEVVSLFFTGGGNLRPAVPTGRVGPVPPSIMITTLALGVNDVACEILFAGYAPGNLGLYQANFRIPANAPSRLSKFTIRVGSATGQESLIPIQ